MIKTKVCSKCGKRKKVTEFYSHIRHSDGLSSHCKLCHAASGVVYRAQHVVQKKNRDKLYRQSNREKLLAKKAEYRRQWLAYIKADQLQCTACGYHKSYAALEFHHIDPTQKEFTISQFFNRACSEKNKQVMARELKKCRVLCSNCHKELHEFLNQQNKKGVRKWKKLKGTWECIAGQLPPASVRYTLVIKQTAKRYGKLLGQNLYTHRQWLKM